MEQELTVEELIALINSQKGDFIIRIESVSYTHLTLPTICSV